MNAARWWLSLAYLVASLMAQGVHDHGKPAHADAPESRGDCDEARPHVADHEVADHSQPPPACPSCQFRAEAALWVRSLRPMAGEGVAIPGPRARLAPRPGAPLTLRCRAPPPDDNLA